jgi:predicted acetyltransferase
MCSMELMEPSLRFIESYKCALAEFERDGISGFWKFFGPVDDAETYLRNIKRYQHRGGLQEDLVPATVYWLVEGDEFIGHVSIRHELNAALEKQGGHIGYAIRPSKQQQGYGSRLLELALPKAKKIGIQRALATCDKSNVASRKIIEKNGGVLSDEISVDGKELLRFWFSL